MTTKQITEELNLFRDAWRRPRTRTMLEFAEQEIIIPDGRFEGLHFRVSRQPFVKLWFEQVANPHWYECVVTGPSQSGKTLVGFVIPILYHLFELRQTVIAAVPDFDMVADKWTADILPALERTRYRNYLPGGRVSTKQSLIEFLNGSKLRWMTAGGSDKSRAAFTAPTVCMTETDGFDIRTSTSTEANKIEQIEARMRSFPLRDRRIYKECTVSVAEAHTWERYEQGTRSEIKLPCKHCGEFVQLEREHFVGWQECKTDTEAVESAAFHCCGCGEYWTEADRHWANDHGVLVHRGQQIKDGKVIGPVPETYTLGFRWSAVNNMLVPAGDIGRDEFNASRSVDEDDEERKMSQFVWCQPYRPLSAETSPLTIDAVQRRVLADARRGVCPENTRWVTVGIDVNKPVLHWTAIAWCVDGTDVSSRIIDYGKNGIKTNELGFDEAIKLAVRKLSRTIGATWENTPSGLYSRVVIDSRWCPEEVGRALRALKDKRWRPFIGLGAGHWKRRTYVHPEQQQKNMSWVGNAAYEKFVTTRKMRVTFADADWWKTWLHSRLTMDLPKENEPAKDCVMTLFSPSSELEEAERLSFARQLTAEKETIHFEHGKGYVRHWEAIRSANHWLDSTYMACVAGNRFWHKLTAAKTARRRKVVSVEHNRRPTFSPLK